MHPPAAATALPAAPTRGAAVGCTRAIRAGATRMTLAICR